MEKGALENPVKSYLDSIKDKPLRTCHGLTPEAKKRKIKMFDFFMEFIEDNPEKQE